MKQKKPTHPNPEVSGFNCVGLLINRFPGDGADLPFTSYPMISACLEISSQISQSRYVSHYISKSKKIPKTLPILSVRMKTQGEIESAISEAMSRFEQEYMGRGPKDVHAYLIDDLLVVRLKGVLTAAEQHLVKTLQADKGRDLLKQVRTHLIETARPAMEAMIQDITGKKVLSLHHDISTLTGEEVVLFTLAESPIFREIKKR
jgi:uncharacterized protein YbcI